MIHQISIHVISIHGLCLKFITLSCQLTFGQPSFPASVPIPPEKQRTPWNLWICSTYTWPKRGTYQRGLLPKYACQNGWTSSPNFGVNIFENTTWGTWYLLLQIFLGALTSGTKLHHFIVKESQFSADRIMHHHLEHAHISQTSARVKGPQKSYPQPPGCLVLQLGGSSQILKTCLVTTVIVNPQDVGL